MRGEIYSRLPHWPIILVMVDRFQNIIAGVRHLCSLGLAAEILVPQFLIELEQAIPADIHHFSWFDTELRPIRLFCNRPELHGYMPFLVDFLNQQPIGTPAWEDAKSSLVRRCPNPLIAEVLDFIDQEMRRPLGTPHELREFLFHPFGAQGSIGLWRSGRCGFTSAEAELLRDASRYLSYALAMPPETDLPRVEGDDSGLVLLDAKGVVIDADPAARRLLALAKNPSSTIPLDVVGDEPLAEVFASLGRLSRGEASRPPEIFLHNHWGLFRFRAHWLHLPAAGDLGLVAVTVSRFIPRRLALWRAVVALHLPVRQSEVCLWFAEGFSLSEIAERLNLSRHTVVDHMRRLYQRLEIEPDRDKLRDRLLGLPTAR